jgi:hypothetical protein
MDGKNSFPGPGISIPDPRHCMRIYFRFRNARSTQKHFYLIFHAMIPNVYFQEGEVRSSHYPGPNQGPRDGKPSAPHLSIDQPAHIVIKISQVGHSLISYVLYRYCSVFQSMSCLEKVKNKLCGSR